jgi:hypothetical protein
MSVELRDARRSGEDSEWLTNVYPLYLHDLSEFDDGYYQLNDRGLWGNRSPAELAAGRSRSSIDHRRVRTPRRLMHW